METIGSYLRQQREKAGIPVEQIASSTKVRAALLRELEEDRLDRLPGGVFLRGFVRSYLGVLGIRPDRALEILDGHMGQGFDHVPAPLQRGDREAGSSRFKALHLLVLVFAVLAMLGAYFLTSGMRQDQSAMTSAQSTDADSGTTRSFSPLSPDR